MNENGRRQGLFEIVKGVIVKNNEVKSREFYKVIEGVPPDTNLVIAYCRVHGDNSYFERVEGDFFRCANKEHRDEVVHLSDSTPILGRTFDK